MKILTALIVAMVVRSGQCNGGCKKCRDTYINGVQVVDMGQCELASPRLCEIAEQVYCSAVEHSFKIGNNEYHVVDESCAIAKDDQESACAAAKATATKLFGVFEDFVCRQATCDHPLGVDQSCNVVADFDDWVEYMKQYLEAAAAAEETKEDEKENNDGSYVSSETRVNASILLVGIVSFLV